MKINLNIRKTIHIILAIIGLISGLYGLTTLNPILLTISLLILLYLLLDVVLKEIIRSILKIFRK